MKVSNRPLAGNEPRRTAVIRAKHLPRIATVIAWCALLFCGCQSGTCGNASAEYPNATNRPTGQIDFEKIQRENEERLRNPHPSDWPFPNFQTGPGRPLPNYVNFYRIDDRFPSYLLCEYDVNVKPYDASKESRWFKSALEQVRRSGSTKFPPIKWIAATIRNVAEHKDASTFEGSFRVGAIFNAADVFDPTNSLKALIGRTVVDRHPFVYDPNHPSGGEDQRWMIVERHAATTHATTNSNEKATQPEPRK